MQQQETIEQKIEAVLDKIRPFLQREGGDIKLDRYDEKTGICYVDMVGACAGCVMASSDISDSVEVMVLDEVPEVKKVELISPSTEQSFDDLLRRLSEQQMAEEDFKKQQERNENGNGTPSSDGSEGTL